MFHSSPKSHPGLLKMNCLAFLTNLNAKTKHFQWKLIIKMVHLGGRLQGVQISVWLLFSFVSYWLQSWENLACSWRKVILAKIQRVIIFEPYEEWSWNFQGNISFMKASYGLSFNKIWGVTHTIIWWFHMEWPFRQ